ncbi:hypothetical protein AOLI_G00259230 [Acnodon oligacanthus]
MTHVSCVKKLGLYFGSRQEVGLFTCSKFGTLPKDFAWIKKWSLHDSFDAWRVPVL